MFFSTTLAANQLLGAPTGGTEPHHVSSPVGGRPAAAEQGRVSAEVGRLLPSVSRRPWPAVLGQLCLAGYKAFTPMFGQCDYDENPGVSR